MQLGLIINSKIKEALEKSETFCLGKCIQKTIRADCGLPIWTNVCLSKALDYDKNITSSKNSGHTAWIASLSSSTQGS